MEELSTSSLQRIRAAYTQQKADSDRQFAWLDRYFWRPISFYLTVPFVNAGNSANQVTILSHIVGLISLFMFGIGTYASLILGGLLFALYVLLDYIDGNIARLQGPSKLGHFLDSYPWSFIHIALPSSLALGLYSHPDWLMQHLGIAPYNDKLLMWGLLGSLFTATNDLSLWIYMVRVENQVATADFPAKPSPFWRTLVHDLANLGTTYYVSLLFFAVIGCPSFYLFVFALGRVLRFPILIVSHLTNGVRLLDKR